MVDEEIFVLTHHADFQADYIEKLPIYRRRHFLYLLERENDAIEEMRDKARNQNNFRPR